MGALVLPGVGLVLACLPLAAAAHGEATAIVTGGAPGWTITLVLLLFASAMSYAIGVRRLWRRAGAGRGVRGVHVLRFALGWLVLAAALFSPIDALADRSFALHMLQHEMLMLVAAPLLVLARPLEAWTWALAPRLRQRMAIVARARWTKRGWRLVTSASGAWCLHAAAVWIWHVPALFLAAVANPSLHVAQHACFLGSALLFWWSVLRHRAGVHGAGAMISVFTTMLHTSALGALLTLAAHPVYLATGQATALGLTALEDQQLGGLVMWVPGSLAYLVAGLVVVAGCLSPVRVRQHVA
jgi:putative membrane protein